MLSCQHARDGAPNAQNILCQLTDKTCQRRFFKRYLLLAYQQCVMPQAYKYACVCLRSGFSQFSVSRLFAWLLFALSVLCCPFQCFVCSCLPFIFASCFTFSILCLFYFPHQILARNRNYGQSLSLSSLKQKASGLLKPSNLWNRRSSKTPNRRCSLKAPESRLLLFVNEECTFCLCHHDLFRSVRSNPRKGTAVERLLKEEDGSSG